MADFAALTFEELISRISEPKNTLILFHRNPDADAVGSAYAMKKILADLGSRAWCVCGEEIPARLRFLCDAEQESVLPENIPTGFEIERIVAVDTASPFQLGRLSELYGDRVDLMIDHHGVGEPYADHYIRPDAAATGEIMFDLVKQLATDGLMQIDEALCIDLYAAISADTGGFRFSNVTADTHLRAAELMASGIDSAQINHLLFDCFSMEQLRARAAGISNLQLFADGKIAVITFPYAIKAALGLEDHHMSTLVDVARSLEGVMIAISVRQPGTDGSFHVSMRASCDYDVSEVCARFGGGGHERAAGCTFSAENMEDAVEKLVGAIDFDALN